ncbi:MAG TPA: polyprenyl synthetase family protein [Phaeodactylibacter sp.]|nr:polyprenyl synthetase family protein [Phaeodactylibacter sp.]
MVSSLKTIKRPISAELKIFEQRFREDMRSNVPLFDKITYYIVQRKGKEIRPMFVFLCAQIGGEVNEASYHAASLVELLHTATLVHDDVVNDSYEDRGFFSLNAIWKNKIAVLVGDYLLQKGFIIALQNKCFLIFEILANAVKKMNEGTLLAIEKTRQLNVDEKMYFEITRYKTASLIAAACESGAASTSEDKELIENMKNFGEKIGIAFQIRDDLFDYATNAIGNPLAVDFKEKGISLPLVYALHQADFSQKRKIINDIKRKKNTKEVIAFVQEKGGVKYAQQMMQKYKNEALSILQNFPASEAKAALEELVKYVIERKK